jgi:hypothetical protein
MDRSAKRGPLLYVSNTGGAINVYSYPKGKLVGQLDGNEPSGLCSDSNGNVFVTNFRGETIAEYAHGETSRIETLSDAGTNPEGCAVDPTTGDLAVTGYLESINGPSQPGAFAIYRKAKGSPTHFYVPYAATSFCGYDDKGNLFVDGFGWGEQPGFVLTELRKGAVSPQTVSLNFSPGGPGAVQWDGESLAVGDTSAEIYQYAINAGSGTQVGSTSLGLDGYMGQFWIHGSQVIVPTYRGSDPAIWFFRYPGGGDPIKEITGQLKGPFGVTVSVAPR